MSAAALTLVACCGFTQEEETARGFHAGQEFLDAALTSGCTISFRPTGRVDDIRTFLDCGCGAVLIAQPMNLFGRVKLETTEQALSFVRLFSSRDTYKYVSGADLIEVYPAERSGPFELERNQFASLGGARPEVRAHSDQHGHKQFTVVRTVVSLRDGSLNEVVESVHADGYYSQTSVRRLADDVKTYGMVFY
jgi:hypothetical protein